MPTELKDIQVDFISLVSSGANGKRVIWKKASDHAAGDIAFETSLRKVVKDDEKRMVYGIVYSPEDVDSQGEFATRAEIEKAAYGFMKGLRLCNVDAQHDFDPKAAFVAESWLTKGVDPLFPSDPEGSWAVGIRVEDDGLWSSVKKGDIGGLSMAGYAKKIRKGEDGFLAKIEELVGRLLRSGDEVKKEKAEGGAEAQEGVAEIVAALKAMPGISEKLEKMEHRLKELETSTPGKQSKSVDPSKPDESVSFV
jgi:hypothetical protein